MRLRELKVTYEATNAPALFPQLKDPSDAARYFHTLLRDEPIEVGIVLCLSAKHHVLCWHELSRGTVQQTLVHPREVFKAAFLSNATCIVLGHNHPSGDPTPSPEDGMLTRRLKDAGELLGVELVDSIIVGDEDRYFSFRETGHMPEKSSS